MSECICRWYTDDMGGGYFEHQIEPDPDYPTHGPAMTSNETKGNEHG